ncbi:lipase [Rhodococcus kroppenstedtii]|uniref:lipase family protein n=1 Tax=Rhodococcoides kroppenstedtii TaxID=293050 RepID=UPI001C9B6672|nr:lipase family protein [Rhodococcus kroppenstedtii]MBY6436216.1 lipase [Rhodococcus kroppenstedtii]
MKRSIRGTVGAVAVALIAATLPALTAPTAAAAPDFYTPPAQFDTTPGAVVRTEPMPVYLAAPAPGDSYPVTGTRVMYTSRTEAGDPVAVTGTYLEAGGPWTGAGPRPTIVVAPGTIGQGDQCAPSRAFSTGLNAALSPPSLSANQELVSSTLWRAMGARVFVTDYIGLGTPGLHTYVNRLEQAHAVLDAARAANSLAGDPSAPVGFWGYSQGGGATAAAAELAGQYAPELNVKGTWAGAPTADLLEVLGTVDGTLIGGVIGYALNGFVERHPELQARVDERTTETGKRLLAEVSTECIADTILRHPFLRTDTLTRDGRPLLENLGTIPEAGPILAQQRIGNLRPSAPVFVTSGRHDDTVPYGQARRLAEDWCGRGGAVTFLTDEIPPILTGAVLPNHFGPQLIDGYGGAAARYMMDRFAGVPVSGCSGL